MDAKAAEARIPQMLERILATEDADDVDPADAARSGGEVGRRYEAARQENAAQRDRSPGLRRATGGPAIPSPEEASLIASEHAKAAMDLGISVPEYEMILKVRHADRLGIPLRDYLAMEREPKPLSRPAAPRSPRKEAETPWVKLKQDMREAEDLGITVRELRLRRDTEEAEKLGITVEQLRKRKREELH